MRALRNLEHSKFANAPRPGLIFCAVLLKHNVRSRGKVETAITLRNVRFDPKRNIPLALTNV
jgi:hypothetical protein